MLSETLSELGRDDAEVRDLDGALIRHASQLVPSRQRLPAVRDAWAMAPTRVWLHTCTLDHPNAVPNYRARGFVPYRTETYEVD